MLRFLPQNEPQYFDYVVRVTNKVEGKGYDFESIYAKDTKIAASLNGHMGVFFFSYTKSTNIEIIRKKVFFFFNYS